MGRSMHEGDLSIHHFILSNENIVLEHNIIPLNERIRDMIYIEEISKLFLFLETSTSIGILEVDN